ncbi:DUF1446-domain-containing protein [Ophiobolus disseminans]|uniref:DUF1446-domain-containing protein n=1 Tax=Ophiobolus disseminans TaxID=1469910 RepID=A0A6A6ZLJ1_9PLEO|nr:DUF1446-domain-containing protein [Ophiobolus disseminans]
MGPRRAIRIGNASGAIGDGLDQVYRLARDGDVDAITADYLAEFNLAWKAIERIDRPDLGYEPHFLTQLAWNDGEAARLIAQKKIKIVHDGGALNPKALAEKVHEYLESQGITSLRIAWVSGDNLIELVRSQQGTSYQHLDIKGAKVEIDTASILAANAYTGQAGIVAALKAGADIVICGRCCDASPVMGFASWWHDWSPTDYNQLAGSLMAGHIIECGAYATGGNYCGSREIPKLQRVGYPIAEIDAAGQCIITKPDHSNGAVTIDTVKAQFLYEIQGSQYLNADVIARIDGANIRQVGKDRVQITNITGSPPPPTLKLALFTRGGYQAELSAYCAGLDIAFKVSTLKTQVLAELDASEYSTLDITAYGTAAPDPTTQAAATVMIRMFVQADTKDAIERFRRAIYYNGMQGYCGLHLGMDWRTLEPRVYVRYFPALIEQGAVELGVHFAGQKDSIRVGGLREFGPRFEGQESYETKRPVELEAFGKTVRRPLGDLVFARSGDKGGNANIGLWVREADAYPWLQSFLTIPRLIGLLGDDWQPGYRIERFEAPNLWAVHFVVYGILQEGVSSSSVLDGFAKSFGEFVRAREADLPVGLLAVERARREGRGWVEGECEGVMAKL